MTCQSGSLQSWPPSILSERFPQFGLHSTERFTKTTKVILSVFVIFPYCDCSVLLRGIPAVDSEHLACNVRRLIRGQEQCCLSRLGRLGGPAKRDNIGRQILD